MDRINTQIFRLPHSYPVYPVILPDVFFFSAPSASSAVNTPE